MPDPSLAWLDTLPDLRVPGVPGVPSQKTAVSAGTPQNLAGVPGVPEQERNTWEHLSVVQGVPAKPLRSLKEHLEHLGTPNLSEPSAAVPALDLAAGIARLRAMARPSIARPEVWTAIVSDAAWLAESGWAGQAMKLGWDRAELFGISPGPDWQSLAVWLGGRRPLLVGERTAFVDKDGWRAIFNRRPSREAIMLWEIDKWLAERLRGDPRLSR